MASAPKIHVHQSSPDAFCVNSLIIEGEKSLVLVDTQFVLSEAKALAETIASLDKTLAAILITHPHPDHYNGLATILADHPGTRVHATAATIAGIRETAEPKRAYWTPIIGANYPQTFAFPDVVLQDGEKLSIDGIDLIIDDFGPLECSDNTTLSLPQIDAVIISDLVYHRVHPWLAEGRSDLWLSALAEAKAQFAGARAIYAGHGQAGSTSLIDKQADYIAAIRDMVVAALKQDPVMGDAGKSAVRQGVLAAFPDWPLEMIIDMSTESLAGEIKSRSAPESQARKHS